MVRDGDHRRLFGAIASGDVFPGRNPGAESQGSPLIAQSELRSNMNDYGAAHLEGRGLASVASSAADRNIPTARNRAQRDETRQAFRHYARRAWHRPGRSVSRSVANPSRHRSWSLGTEQNRRSTTQTLPTERKRHALRNAVALFGSGQFDRCELADVHDRCARLSELGRGLRRWTPCRRSRPRTGEVTDRRTFLQRSSRVKCR